MSIIVKEQNEVLTATQKVIMEEFLSGDVTVLELPDKMTLTEVKNTAKRLRAYQADLN